jgi:hypothetical protein
MLSAVNSRNVLRLRLSVPEPARIGRRSSPKESFDGKEERYFETGISEERRGAGRSGPRARAGRE